MTPEQINEAIILYKKGMPYYKIAQQLNVGRKTVSKYIQQAGYASNPKYVRKIDPNKLRKYNYDYAESIFETIDTEEKAYWLGFLYADGYVDTNKKTVSLCVAEKDYNHIIKFRSFFKLEEKKIHKKIKDNKFISYEFSVSSEKICNDIQNKGCTQKKTFNLVFPNDSVLPQNMVIHFIRGYMDGDGSITHGGNGSSKISLEMLGTSDFLLGYLHAIKSNNMKLYNFNHSDIKRSILSGPDAIIALDKIYNNATIYLERKYDKYLQLRRLALQSPRTARLLAGKIGEGLTVNTEVTTDVVP